MLLSAIINIIQFFKGVKNMKVMSPTTDFKINVIKNKNNTVSQKTDSFTVFATKKLSLKEIFESIMDQIFDKKPRLNLFRQTESAGNTLQLLLKGKNHDDLLSFYEKYPKQFSLELTKEFNNNYDTIIKLQDNESFNENKNVYKDIISNIADNMIKQFNTLENQN